MLISRLDFVRARAGDRGVERVLASLPPKDAEAMRGQLLPIGWYPLALCLRLDEVVARTLNPQDPDNVFIEMGIASATANLTAHQDSFLTPGDPHQFLGMASQIYRLYYDIGRRVYEKTGPTSGVLRTTGAEHVTWNDCLTVVGWYQKALQMCGARGVKVTHPVCCARGGKVCEYQVEWQDVQK